MPENPSPDNPTVRLTAEPGATSELPTYAGPMAPAGDAPSATPFPPFPAERTVPAADPVLPFAPVIPMAAPAAPNGPATGASSEPPIEGRTARSLRSLLVAAAIGGAVSLSLGVYGKVHEGTGDTVEAFGFPDVLSMKAWFATVAAVLALLQLVSALWMWGRLPGAGRPPSWVAAAHRWTGTVAFLFTLPAAYHCLWSLGFKDTDARVLAHSILGCAFYGAFTTKMLVLRSDTAPRWALPVMGGALVAILTAIWLTSSLWFFTNVGFPGV